VKDLATLRVRERGEFVLASVAGEIDVSNAGTLLRELAAAVPNSALGLLLDFSELEFLDSSGVHMLYQLAERLGNRQQRFAVVLPVDRPPRRTIELSGVEPTTWLHEDLAAGLASLGAA
jgi:anti-anti-sigma factor